MTQDSISARAQRARRRLSALIDEVCPAGLGHWFEAWEMTHPSMEKADAAIRAWANFPENERNKENMTRLVGKAVGAWQRAAAAWVREGSPQDFGTPEHRESVQRNMRKRQKAKRYTPKKRASS